MSKNMILLCPKLFYNQVYSAITLCQLVSSAVSRNANSLDPEQARQNARPDLDSNCFAL